MVDPLGPFRQTSEQRKLVGQFVQLSAAAADQMRHAVVRDTEHRSDRAICRA